MSQPTSNQPNFNELLDMMYTDDETQFNHACRIIRSVVVDSPQIQRELNTIDNHSPDDPDTMLKFDAWEYESGLTPRIIIKTIQAMYSKTELHLLMNAVQNPSGESDLQNSDQFFNHLVSELLPAINAVSMQDEPTARFITDLENLSVSPQLDMSNKIALQTALLHVYRSKISHMQFQHDFPSPTAQPTPTLNDYTPIRDAINEWCKKTAFIP